VTIPGQGTFDQVCDFCRVGPLYPLIYSDGKEGEYCSPQCRERGKAMKNPEFGGAEVHRPTCDHCHGPTALTQLWRKGNENRIYRNPAARADQ